jgi:hypothetical protein
MTFDWNKYEGVNNSSNGQAKSSGFDWNNFEAPVAEDSNYKSALRSALQIPLGYLKKFTYPADLLKSAVQGGAEQTLRDLSENDPELNTKIAREQIENNLQYFPTQGLAEQLIEEKTGIPLQPQNKLQNLIRLGSEAGSFRPGGAIEKSVAATVAPAVSYGAQQIGLPEPISDLTGLVASGLTPAPKSVPVTKPSGLTQRKFESLEKPTTVSPSRYEKIQEAVKKDFTEITENLLKKNKTFSAMKEDAGFKNKIDEIFDKVEILAKDSPIKISNESIKQALLDKYKNRPTEGIVKNEYETSYDKEIRKLFKQIPHGENALYDTYRQFRKNNRALSEYYEPSKSKASNRGKKEALLDFNRAIEDVFEKQVPDSEFSQLFKFSNKRYSEIRDVEQIDSFLEKLFEGNISYGQAKKLLNNTNDNLARPFKRALGDEGYKNFNTLLKDLLSTEKGMKNLKVAQKEGWKGLFKEAAPYMISPTLGKSYSLSKFAKRALNMSLDKPQVIIKWKNALENLNKGKFKEAESSFKELDKLVNE